MKRSILCVMVIILCAGFVSAEGGSTSDYIGRLLYVPGGSFQRDDNPQNISTVSAFLMAQYMVTSEQFTEVTGLEDFSFFKRVENSPVETVNWYTAAAFCNYLSILEGFEPVYEIKGNTDPSLWEKDDHPQNRSPVRSDVTARWEADGYRLPTEMEWMWAAMGADTDAPGEINTTGYKKAFAGDRYGENWKTHIGDYAWSRSNSKTEGENYRSPKPVGTKKPNELGLYDMSGNVAEWCWDMRSYPNAEGHLVDYRGGNTGKSRIYRGGAWESRQWSALSISGRASTSPSNTYNMLGFRVVRSP